jgi:hypothetical protein
MQEIRFIFDGLHGVISQKIGLLHISVAFYKPKSDYAIRENTQNRPIKHFEFTYFYLITQELQGPVLKVKIVALVRKRTIPTERPSLVSEVSAKC